MECWEVDKSPKTREEASPKEVNKMSKEFFAILYDFQMFVVQWGEIVAHNNKIAKLLHWIKESLGVINSTWFEWGFAKVTIKVRLLNSFARKETKTKRVWLWLHQVKVYMEMQHLKTNKKWKHFIQILLTEHTWERWMSPKQETLDLLETLAWEGFKLWLDKRFTLHHLVLWDGMELLEFTRGDNRGYLATYV